MSDRAAAVAIQARRDGFWLGELSSLHIKELRGAGLTVRVMNQTARGDWACEVERKAG